MTKTIYVIDPGMMEAGGHHAALLETLTESEHHGAQISIFTHEKLDDKLAEKARNCGITVIRHFKTNFYQHYEDSLELKISAMQGYIRYLAWEYAKALEYASKPHNNDEIICFYPCLNWEHAFAFSLAIPLLSKSLKLSHKVCCMFRPDCNIPESRLYYSIAFKALAKVNELEFYSSDWETSEYYRGLGVSLNSIHPCYLLPWKKLNTIRKVKSDVPNILLYMGDAKVNKGFLKLPELIREKLLHYNFKVILKLQYTMAWEKQAILDTINELKMLALKYKQVELIEKFWSTQDILECMNSTDMIICNYDTEVYKYKTSGLVWLARYFSVPLLVDGSCWLTRELRRLGFDENRKIYLSDYNLPSQKNIDNNYFQNIYGDFITWLIK